MAADVLPQADELPESVEETGRVESAGCLEGRLAQAARQLRDELRGRGVPLDDVEEPPGEEDEFVSAYRAAAEVTRLLEQGSDSVSLGDVAAAWENFRLVHDSLIAERPAP